MRNKPWSFQVWLLIFSFLFSSSLAKGNNQNTYLSPPPSCPNPPTIQSIDVVNTQCGTTTGAITLNMAGNVSNLSFSWSPDMGDVNAVSNLVAGLYRVTITDNSQTDCAIDTFIVVQNNDGPEANIISTSPTICVSSNGTAELGPANLEFLWSDLVTANTRNNLTNKTYGVTATDPATNCYSVLAVTIGYANPLSSDVQINEPATCNEPNGTATAIVTGGSGDYSYSWGVTNQNTTLLPGDYGIEVADNNTGCTDSAYFNMPNAFSQGDIAVTNILPASCSGGANGTAVFDVVEGFPFGEPYTVDITNSAGQPKVNGFLSVGAYTALLRDAGGCFVDSVNFQMTENSSLLAIPHVIPQTCDVGGIISLDVSGGVPPYYFDWEDLAGNENPKDRSDLVAGNYTVTVRDNLGCQFKLDVINVGNDCGSGNCTSPVVVSEIIVQQSDCGLFNGSAEIIVNGDPEDYDWEWSPQVGVSIPPGNKRTSLGVGSFFVRVTDKLNIACNTDVEFAITNTNGPQAEVISTSPITCNGLNGSAVIGPDTYTYTWADGSNSTIRNDLSKGYHFVTVTDGSCENVLTVLIVESNTLDASAVINSEPDCGLPNGSVTINVANGSGSYDYDWGAGPTHNGLPAGNYDVEVRDLVSGCDTTVSFVLNNNVAEAHVTINGPVFTSCAGSNDGLVDFDVSYDPGFALPATIEIQNYADSLVENGEMYVGPHCIVVKDANDCVAGQGCFFVNSPIALSVYSAIEPVTCVSSGGIDLTVTGGDGGYTYDWDDLAGSDNPEDRAGLSAGAYQVTISDANGCSVVQSNINVPDICGCDVMAGGLVADSTDICDQKPNMIISATPDGNAFVSDNYVLKYVLTKMPGNIVQQIGDNPQFAVAGSGTFVIHTLVVDLSTFDLGQIIADETTIYEINSLLIQGGGLICGALDVDGAEVIVNKCTVCNLPDFNVVVTDAHCGLMDGAITLQFEQDTTGFEFEWSPDVGNTSSLSDLGAGAYYVTVSEYGDQGCATSKTIVVSNEDGPQVTIDSIAPTICTAVNGFVRILPATYDYLWENGSESNVRSSLTDTTYAITVTDPADGCFSVIAIDIEREDPLSASIEIISQPQCGQPNGHAALTVEGGSGEYTYSWGNIGEKQTLLPGLYSVVVVDTEYGCNEIVEFELINEQKNLIIDDSLSIFSGTCPDTYPLCLDLPASNAFGYVYTDNGSQYAGNITACGADTIRYYDAEIFQGDQYQVIFPLAGIAHQATITNQQELLDSLLAWDPFSGWALEDDKYIAQNPHAANNSLLATNMLTGELTILPFEIEAIEKGVQLSLTPGDHVLMIQENSTGCRDTLVTDIECITCPSTYSGVDTLFAGVCGVDTAVLCLDIPVEEVSDYTFRDNWAIYAEDFVRCGPSGENVGLKLGPGGHQVFVTNNATYCTDTLSIFVVCVPPADYIIRDTIYEGETTNICLDNSILPGIPINYMDLCDMVGRPLVEVDFDYSDFCMDVTGVAFGDDQLCMQVCDNMGNCAMTYIYITVLPKTDTLFEFVTIGTTKEFCMDLYPFSGGIASVNNLCPEFSNHEVGVSLSGNTGCMIFSGDEIGVDTICLEICDSLNHCDTTIIFVESNYPKPDTVNLELIIGLDTIICMDVSELPGTVEIFSTICPDAPGIVEFMVSNSTMCVDVNAYDYGLDTMCFEFCDDTYCDTLVLAVEVIQDTLAPPIAIDDEAIGILNRDLIIHPLLNDLVNGTVEDLRIISDPKYGTVVVNGDYTMTFTPEIDSCGHLDSFIYELTNKNGTDNAVVYVQIDCEEIMVYSAFSPNNDGVNDFLYIERIDDYPNNEVIVYSRWGNEVFRRKAYTNEDGWDGLWNEAHLPVGTYYFVIDLGTGKKVYSGYIQIMR